MRITGVSINRISKKVTKSKTVYEYIIINTDDTTSEPVTITKKLIKGIRKKTHQQVHDLTLKLIADGYFKTPKNALELFLLYKESIKVPFTPADMQKSLAVCCRKNGDEKALLIQENIDARYVYQQNDELNNTE